MHVSQPLKHPEVRKGRRYRLLSPNNTFYWSAASKRCRHLGRVAGAQLQVLLHPISRSLRTGPFIKPSTRSSMSREPISLVCSIPIGDSIIPDAVTIHRCSMSSFWLQHFGSRIYRYWVQLPRMTLPVIIGSQLWRFVLTLSHMRISQNRGTSGGFRATWVCLLTYLLTYILGL